MDIYENIVGYYEKRDCPGGRYECAGYAIRLNGDLFLFVPYDKKLRPVEAILETTPC
jgi:hypothetical protein